MLERVLSKSVRGWGLLTLICEAIELLAVTQGKSRGGGGAWAPQHSACHSAYNGSVCSRSLPFVFPLLFLFFITSVLGIPFPLPVHSLPSEFLLTMGVKLFIFVIFLSAHSGAGEASVFGDSLSFIPEGY